MPTTIRSNAPAPAIEYSFPAQDVAALFANAQMRTIADALRRVGPGDTKAMSRCIEVAREAIAFNTRRIAGLKDARVGLARFAADMDAMSLIAGDIFDLPKIGWIYGRLAGLSAIIATGQAARIQGRTGDQVVAAWRHGLKRLHEDAANRWAAHIREILIAQRLPTQGVVVDVDVQDLNAPVFVVRSLIPGINDWEA